MPDLHAAARFALYAERMMPVLKTIEQVGATELTGTPEQRGRVGIAKIAADKAIPLVRSLLFPEDDDGPV